MSAKELKLLGCQLQLLGVLSVLGLLATAGATCNVCNTVNQLACYSSTEMQACDASGLPTRIPYSCPAGYVCVSGAKTGVVCQPSGSNTSAVDCLDCNKCDASKTFACTGTSSFALCFGTDTPQNSLGTCASGYVCNVGDSQICGLATQVMPTCSYGDDATTTTTTVATPTTGDAFCAAVQSEGKYPAGDYTATTCRQYFECFQLNGVWTGHKYVCPGKLYYQAETELCDSPLPSRCYMPLSTTTTTVAPTVSNPTAFCEAMQTQDSFPVGIVASTTCRQFITCTFLDGRWRGQLYTCPGSTYYDSASRRCTETLPATCSSRIASLSLNGSGLD